MVPHIRAVAGEHDLFESDGNKEQIRNVIRLTIHEYFDNDTYDNDIALLELNERLHFDNRYVSPITIRDSALSLPGKRSRRLFKVIFTGSARTVSNY